MSVAKHTRDIWRTSAGTECDTEEAAVREDKVERLLAIWGPCGLPGCDRTDPHDHGQSAWAAAGTIPGRKYGCDLVEAAEWILDHADAVRAILDEGREPGGDCEHGTCGCALSDLADKQRARIKELEALVDEAWCALSEWDPMRIANGRPLPSIEPRAALMSTIKRNQDRVNRLESMVAGQASNIAELEERIRLKDALLTKTSNALGYVAAADTFPSTALLAAEARRLASLANARIKELEAQVAKLRLKAPLCVDCVSLEGVAQRSELSWEVVGQGNAQTGEGLFCSYCGGGGLMFAPRAKPAPAVSAEDAAREFCARHLIDEPTRGDLVAFLRSREAGAK
jgi:uncharacterized coiled-coil protein SlyX